MLRYTLKRLAQGVLTVFCIVSAVFVLIRLAPGDPADQFGGAQASGAQLAQITKTFGLDKSIPEQYGIFLTRLLHGDLGTSFSYGQSALSIVFERLPQTLLLAVSVIVVTALVAIPLGVLTAKRANGPADLAVNTITVAGQSMPDFWLGIMLIVLFALHLPLFPTSGFDNGLRSLVLPTVTVSILQIALISRVVRREMIRNLELPYTLNGRARGLSERSIVWRHAYKNAAIPVVTALGTRFASMLNGVVLVEVVFAWPGVGSLVVQALQTRDYPLITATVLVTSLLAILVQLAVDLVYPLLDPRVRLGKAATR